MQTVRMSWPGPLSGRYVVRYSPDATNRRDPCAPDRADEGEDSDFVALLQAYRGSGGLARAAEVAALLERRGEAPIAALTNWIAQRRVISFEWQAQTWLPWFQFARPHQTPEPALAAVLAEWAAANDGWGLARWVVRPNSALAGRTPIQTLPTDPAAVLVAARADRFAAKG